MKKFIIIISIIIVVAILVFVAVKGCGGKKQTFSTNTATVESGDISRTVVATGKIEPLNKAEIKSKIGGLVKRFYAEEGDRVKFGQKLVEIIPGATPVEMVQARTEVKAALFEKQRAEKSYLRNKELLEKKLLSPDLYDKSITDYEITRTRFYAAMAQLRVLEQGSNVSALTGEIELTPQDLKEIEKETQEAIASMTIIAPLDGIVLSRDTDKGSAVIPISSAYGGTVIMTIADVSEKHFRGNVDEADIGKIHLGLPARVFVEAWPDQPFSATLTQISPLGREKEDIINFEIRARIDDPQQKLSVGMSADAEIILEEHKDVLVIPEGAIRYENDSTFVHIENPENPEGFNRVNIEKGISDGIKTEVLSGLEKDQIVIMPK